MRAGQAEHKMNITSLGPIHAYPAHHKHDATTNCPSTLRDSDRGTKGRASNSYARPSPYHGGFYRALSSQRSVRCGFRAGLKQLGTYATLRSSARAKGVIEDSPRLLPDLEHAITPRTDVPFAALPGRRGVPASPREHGSPFASSTLTSTANTCRVRR